MLDGVAELGPSRFLEYGRAVSADGCRRGFFIAEACRLSESGLVFIQSVDCEIDSLFSSFSVLLTGWLSGRSLSDRRSPVLRAFRVNVWSGFIHMPGFYGFRDFRSGPVDQFFISRFHVPAGPAEEPLGRPLKSGANPCSCGASVGEPGGSEIPWGNSMLLRGQPYFSDMLYLLRGHGLRLIERLGLVAPDPGLPGGPGRPRAVATEVASAFAWAWGPGSRTLPVPVCSINLWGLMAALAESSGRWAGIPFGSHGVHWYRCGGMLGVGGSLFW